MALNENDLNFDDENNLDQITQLSHQESLEDDEFNEEIFLNVLKDISFPDELLTEAPFIESVNNNIDSFKFYDTIFYEQNKPVYFLIIFNQ